VIQPQQVAFPVVGKNRAHSELVAIFKNSQIFIMFLSIHKVESFRSFPAVETGKIKKKTETDIFANCSPRKIL
jgi:hypothetical protein